MTNKLVFTYNGTPVNVCFPQGIATDLACADIASSLIPSLAKKGSSIGSYYYVHTIQSVPGSSSQFKIQYTGPNGALAETVVDTAQKETFKDIECKKDISLEKEHPEFARYVTYNEQHSVVADPNRLIKPKVQKQPYDSNKAAALFGVESEETLQTQLTNSVAQASFGDLETYRENIRSLKKSVTVILNAVDCKVLPPNAQQQLEVFVEEKITALLNPLLLSVDLQSNVNSQNPSDEKAAKLADKIADKANARIEAQVEQRKESAAKLIANILREHYDTQQASRDLAYLKELLAYHLYKAASKTYQDNIQRIQKAQEQKGWFSALQRAAETVEDYKKSFNASFAGLGIQATANGLSNIDACYQALGEQNFESLKNALNATPYEIFLSELKEFDSSCQAEIKKSNVEKTGDKEEYRLVSQKAFTASLFIAPLTLVGNAKKTFEWSPELLSYEKEISAKAKGQPFSDDSLAKHKLAITQRVTKELEKKRADENGHNNSANKFVSATEKLDDLVQEIASQAAFLSEKADQLTIKYKDKFYNVYFSQKALDNYAPLPADELDRHQAKQAICEEVATNLIANFADNGGAHQLKFYIHHVQKTNGATSEKSTAKTNCYDVYYSNIQSFGHQQVEVTNNVPVTLTWNRNASLTEANDSGFVKAIKVGQDSIAKIKREASDSNIAHPLPAAKPIRRQQLRQALAVKKIPENALRTKGHLLEAIAEEETALRTKALSAEETAKKELALNGLKQHLKGVNDFLQKKNPSTIALLEKAIAEDDKQQISVLLDEFLNEEDKKHAALAGTLLPAYNPEQAAKVLGIDLKATTADIQSAVQTRKHGRLEAIEDDLRDLQKEAKELLDSALLDAESSNRDVQFNIDQFKQFVDGKIAELNLVALTEEVKTKIAKEVNRLRDKATTGVIKETVESLFKTHQEALDDLQDFKQLLAWCLYETARRYYDDILIKHEEKKRNSGWFNTAYQSVPGLQDKTLAAKRASFNKKFGCIGIEIDVENGSFPSISACYAKFLALDLCAEDKEQGNKGASIENLIRELLVNCNKTTGQHTDSYNNVRKGLDEFNKLCKETFTKNQITEVGEKGEVTKPPIFTADLFHYENSAINPIAYTGYAKGQFAWNKNALNYAEKCLADANAVIVTTQGSNAKPLDDTQAASVPLSDEQKRSTPPGLHSLVIDQINSDSQVNLALNNASADIQRAKVLLEGTKPARKATMIRDVNPETGQEIIPNPSSQPVKLLSLKQQIADKKVELQLQNLCAQANEAVVEARNELKSIADIQNEIKVICGGLYKNITTLDSEQQKNFRGIAKSITHRAEGIVEKTRAALPPIEAEYTKLQKETDLSNARHSPPNIRDKKKREITDFQNPLNQFRAILASVSEVASFPASLAIAKKHLQTLRDAKSLCANDNESPTACSIKEIALQPDAIDAALETKVAASFKAAQELAPLFDDAQVDAKALSEGLKKLQAANQKVFDSIDLKPQTDRVSELRDIYEKEQSAKPLVKLAQEIATILYNDKYWDGKVTGKIFGKGEDIGNGFVAPKGISLMRNGRAPQKIIANEIEARKFLTTVCTIGKTKKSSSRSCCFSFFHARKDATEEFYFALSVIGSNLPNPAKCNDSINNWKKHFGPKAKLPSKKAKQSKDNQPESPNGNRASFVALRS